MTKDKIEDTAKNTREEKNEQNNKPKEIQLIQKIYAGFIVSLALCLAPSFAVQLFASLLFLIIFIWCYIARKKADAHSLTWNHMTYLIRTIWIGSLFLAIGIIVGTIWFYYAGDHSLITLYMQEIAMGRIPDGYSATQLQIDYMEENKGILIQICLAVGAPTLLYMGYRLAKGVARAIKGYRLADIKKWF